MLTSSLILVLNDIVPTANNQRKIVINAVGSEPDNDLFNGYIYGTINWGDGSIEPFKDDNKSPEFIQGGNFIYKKDISSVSTHFYYSGKFTVTLQVFNKKYPVQDSAKAYINIDTTSTLQQVQESNIIYGPILPLDGSFPNEQQWSFNTGGDVKILASSIKMILTTDLGERLMEQPTGSNIRAMLFDPTDSITLAQIQNTVRTVINSNEPRVKILSVNITKPKKNEASLYIIAKSNITGDQFVTQFNINQ